MSHSLRRWGIAMLALCALCLVTPARAASQVTCGAWNVVPSPNMGSGMGNEVNSLRGVASTAPNDVWAVGRFYNNGPTQGLIEHWDGTTWKIVPSPVLPLSTLTGIARVPGTNYFWAVGSYYSKRTPYTQALFEYWNGLKWKVIPSPHDSSANDFPLGITALSANDVWAVGYSRTFKIRDNNTFTEHWNGSAWSIVSSPNPFPGEDFLSSVAHVPGTHEVWAVGMMNDEVGNTQTLTEYWNGSAWEVVSSPSIAGNTNALSDVYAFAANNIWSVGYTSSQTLIEHWDGAIWSIVPSPNADAYNYLLHMTAASANDMWAVGYSVSDTTGQTAQTLIEQWDGMTWTVVASPNVGSTNYLLDVGYVAHTNTLWAVGYSDNSTLIESYC